jgi:hypothetical protein
MRKITRATIFSSILGVTLFCGLLVFSVSEPERLRLASNNFKVIAHPSIGTEKLPRDRKTASESSDGGLSVARNSYVSEGKIIDHIGSEGRMIRFSPAERDVVARDYYIKIEAWFDLLLAMVKDFRTDLIVSFCLAIVLGFSVGNYERRRA